MWVCFRFFGRSISGRGANFTLGVPGQVGEGGEDGFEDAETLWSVYEGERRMLVPFRNAGEDADTWSERG